MKEIVINRCWGRFNLSHEAIMLYAKLSGFKLYPFVEIREKEGKKWSPTTDKYRPYVNELSKDNPYDLIFYTKKPLNKDGSYDNNSWFGDDDIERDDLNLIKVVKKLKEESYNSLSELKIVKIPFNIKWTIEDYDGMESVEEEHKSYT